VESARDNSRFLHNQNKFHMHSAVKYKNDMNVGDAGKLQILREELCRHKSLGIGFQAKDYRV
jgi:uncharacterized protein YeaO (DUF488 family)